MGRKGKVGGFHTPFAKLAVLKDASQTPPAKSGAGPSAPAPPPGPIPRAKAKSDEDLFLEEMAGTRPLDARARTRVGHAPEAPAGSRRPPMSDDAEVLAELADLCDGTGPFDIADSDEYIEGIAPGVDRRLLKRLRAGDYAVQGHLDLHGLTRDEAKSRVARFVQESRKASRRCVLIVHGRGLHSKDQIPVLKDAVRTWLERGPVARSVLAFATARPHDGGAGAMYVLLRR
jgi:DNA-nicking Smr family endonuclease